MSDLSIIISYRTVIDLLSNAYVLHQVVAEAAYNLCTHTYTMNREQGFLLGVNGEVSAVAWFPTSLYLKPFIIFIFGLFQFFFFSSTSFQDHKEANDEDHGT